MTDFAGFKHGGVVYPLTASTARSMLQDADPTVFYALEFFAAVITRHLEPRIRAEVAKGDMNGLIEVAVRSVYPMNPEPFLHQTHLPLPLLAAYRKRGTPRYQGQRKLWDDELDIVYVMPPMQPAEAERLIPVLKAVHAVVDNRSEQGFDPLYTPTGGVAGERVWARAGLARVEVIGVEFGGYLPSPDTFFPAVVMTAKMSERSEALLTELEEFEGADTTLDHESPDGTVIASFVETSSLQAPVLTSLSVSSGSKAGGTAVVVTGTGFVVGRRYRVLFGGSDASSVLCTSTTTLACTTPQYAAYPTQAVDVVVIDQDGGTSNELANAYTFTTP